jgi:hypothetical protein
LASACTLISVNPLRSVVRARTFQKEHHMRSRAIAGSIAALSFAAVPIAQAASTTHDPATTAARVDHSPDAAGVRHVDKTPDKTSADRSVDRRDR